MNRKSSGMSPRRRRASHLVAVIGLAFLLLAGPALTPGLAGPTQEKGQDDSKETEEEPKKFTNKDLKRGSGSSSSGGETSAAGEDGEATDGTEPGDEAADAPEDQKDPWDSVGVATDNQGRGEAYWRQAMSDARGAVTAAQADHDRLQSEMNLKRQEFTAIDDPAARALVDDRIQELYGLIDESKTAVADAKKALSDLQEDARRSGALPGWLR